MGFLHVLISWKPSDDFECVLSDLSTKELKRRFIKPYRSGKSILIEGRVLPLAELFSVKVICTDRDIDAELQDLQERSQQEIREFNRNSDILLVSPGRGHSDEDIVECGKDVTNEYLSGPPGSSRAAWELLHNPWVVTLVGGFLVAAAIGLVATL